MKYLLNWSILILKYWGYLPNIKFSYNENGGKL